MSQHLYRDLKHLERRILRLADRVEENIRKAVSALRTGRYDHALEVIESDRVIDTLEVEIEEDCLKVLALHQPVAIDLRFVAAVLKINNDLERVGDLAVNIAERASSLATQEPVEVPAELHAMCDRVTVMLRRSLEALVRQDSELARAVIAEDDVVDESNRTVIEQLIKVMHERDEAIESCLLLVSVSRQLERIGDHATNIAEDVVYLARGEIVRHTHAERGPLQSER